MSLLSSSMASHLVSQNPSFLPPPSTVEATEATDITDSWGRREEE